MFMSESVVCKACGSPNRAKAKFCTGCARPLPGFEPSGPSALDPVMSLRLASGTPAGGHAAVPVLPAETAAFWLKAGYWALAMIVGFTLWCLYVTSKPGAPPLKTEIMSLLAPVMKASSSPSAPASAAPAPVSPVAGGAAPAASPPGETASPLHALLPERPNSSGSPQRSSSPAEQPVAATTSPSPSPRPETRPTARPSKGSTYASRASRERADDSPMSPIARSPERRSREPDPGPPIVAGPGPLFDYSRLPTGTPVVPGSSAAPAARPAPDPGPPIVPGPGPRYEPARIPVQAPVVPSNDPGPPIAIGPGPLVDYSTRGAGTR
jgi:hypothetical protein